MVANALGVVTALPQRLLFTSEVHVVCCDLYSRSGVENVLRGWGGLNFLLRRWKFNLRGLFTSYLRGFTCKCFFSLVLPNLTRPTNSYFVFEVLFSNTISPCPVTQPPRLDFQPDSPQKESHSTSTSTSSHWLLLSL